MVSLGRHLAQGVPYILGVLDIKQEACSSKGDISSGHTCVNDDSGLHRSERHHVVD